MPSAIVIANGTLPREAIVRAEIKAADYVVAADGGANALFAMEIVPDAVLGDMDSLGVDLPESVTRIEMPDQSRTDLDKAVRHCFDEGWESVTLIGVTGNRLDHTFGALATVCRYGVRLVDDVGVATSVRGPDHVEIPAQPGQTVSLLPCGRVMGLTTAGLKWNILAEDFDFAVRDGTSNVATAEAVEVALQHGMIVVYVHHRY